MPLVEWSDSLLTGDPEIDEQHKTFFLKMQKLHVACKLGKGHMYVSETLNFLLDYVKLHFQTEEAKMDEIDYSYKVTHREAHEKFAKQLEEVIGRLDKPEEARQLAKETAEMSSEWFAKHIRLVDKPFIDMLRKGKLERSQTIA